MKCIRPNYINDFQCNGKSCQSRCCKGWRIVVDDETYQKYCHIEDDIQRQEILSKLELLDSDKFFIKMNENLNCPFLTEDSLCILQKKYGEEFLTAICHSYPRVTYRIGDILEQSLTLTCPIAARIILLQKETIKFETVEINEPHLTFNWSNKINLPLEDAINLQMSSISILQDRNFLFNERLFRLCLLMSDEFVEEVNFDIDNHAKVMIDIFCKIYNANMDDSKKKNLRKTYVNYHEIILTRLMNEYNNIFENYMVNEFFMRCYPFTFNGGIWENCKIFIIGVKAMEFAIVLTAISKNGLVTADEFLDMIDAINEKLDHNRNGMKFICDTAEQIHDLKTFVDMMIDVY